MGTCSSLRRRMMMGGGEVSIPNYLCFTALEDTTFTLTIPSGMTTSHLTCFRYSIDGITWDTLENVNNTEVSITTPIITAGNVVYLKGKGSRLGTSATVYSNISSTGKFDVSGNIASLIYEDTFETFYSAPRVEYIFGNFFRNSKVVHAGKLVLPVKQQYYTYSLYCNLFRDCTELIECAPVTFAGASGTWSATYRGCTSLETPPIFPEGLRLETNCFAEMFYGCTSLKTAPVLPYTKLANSCYKSMFYGCTSLTEAPQLPATELKQYCYERMFNDCSNLLEAPVLPALNTQPYCYQYMFAGCTAIKTLPELPATTLTERCYRGMFRGLPITTIPSGYLPVTTLASACYQDMFHSCKELVNIPKNLLPATSLTNACYYSMFNNCTSLVNAPELPATSMTSECYSGMFEGCTKLINVPDITIDSLNYQSLMKMFNGCTSLISIPIKKLPNSFSKVEVLNGTFMNCTQLTGAVELPAEVLTNSCYLNAFRSTKISYIKMLATDISATGCLGEWLNGVPNVSTSIFVKNINATWTKSGNSGVPTNWTVIYYDSTEGKYYTSQDKSQECDDHGNPI